jgi:formylglycine-generating enzyme required for sulfatase activity
MTYSQGADPVGSQRPSLTMTRQKTEYLTAVMSQTEYLAFGNPHGYRFDHQLRLQDVWIPQDATATSYGDAFMTVSPQERIGLRERRSIQIDAALNMATFGKTVVTARPGYGKSTLCRRLAYKQALDAKVAGRGWIPLLINAASVNQSGVWQSFDEMISRNQLVKSVPGLVEQLSDAAVEGHIWFFVDGLDEVDEARVPDFISFVQTGILATPNRVVITCRVADYWAVRPSRRLEGLPVLDLSGFGEERLDSYIEAWHRTAARGRPQLSDARIDATRRLLDAHTELRDLADSPLLAAVLCVVETRPGENMVGRAALLRQAVDYLLLRPEWRQASVAGYQYTAPLDPEVLLAVVAQFAFELLNGNVKPQAARTNQAGLSHEELLKYVGAQLISHQVVDRTDKAECELAVIAYTNRMIGRGTVGLLQADSADCYVFAHRSFQEYLAAVHLLTGADRVYRAVLAEQAEWREVFLLTASICQTSGAGLTDLLMLVRTLIGKVIGNEQAADERATQLVCLAVEMLAELGEAAIRRFHWEAVVDGDPRRVGDDLTFAGLWPSAAECALALSRNTNLPEGIRIRALCAASRLRDIRFVGRDGTVGGGLGKTVPIPGGRGAVGTAMSLKMHELKRVASSPRRKVDVTPFRLGRYPVTNLEYGTFIADDGYENPSWWRCCEEAEAWRSGDTATIDSLVDLWEQQKQINFFKEFSEPEFADYTDDVSRRIAYRIMRRTAPLYWRDNRFMLPTAPVVGVNLWEARAYCAWLESRWKLRGAIENGDTIAVPSEIEWEWAASRGWTGRPLAYPWGSEFRADRCLVRDFTAAADSLPIAHFGAIPVGYYDHAEDLPQEMAGNVWEWTSSLAIPWDDQSDREVPGGLATRVVRGGSWFSREPNATRTSFRLDDPPCNAYWDLGFRVVVRGPAASAGL